MLNQKLKTKNRYLDEFLFLYDLVNEFTKKLGIENRLFYFKVQRHLRNVTLFEGFEYHTEGLSSSKKILSVYRRKTKLYNIAPYLASFSRLLSVIYREASLKIGEEKASEILHHSFDLVKKKYSREPDLQGYVPSVALGKAAAAAAAAAAIDVSLMDNLLNYMLNEVIEKGISSVGKKLGNEVSELSPEEMKEKIKYIYLEILGPLGAKQVDKLDKVDINTINEQITIWRDKEIISEEKAQNIRERVSSILKVKKR